MQLNPAKTTRRLSLRGFHPHRLRPAPVDQGADRGLIISLFRRSSLRLFPLIRVEVDVRTLGALSILLLSLASVSAQDGNPFRVEIDLQQQTAFLIRGTRSCSRIANLERPLRDILRKPARSRSSRKRSIITQASTARSWTRMARPL